MRALPSIGPVHRASLAAVTLTLCLALTAAGCGGEDSDSDGAQSDVVRVTIRGPQPPRGASLVLREIYRNFQPPLPNPAVEGSAKAIAAGKRACKGKTPLEVKREFIAESDLTADQRKAVSELAQYDEPTANYPAGQLAALVYQGTLGEEPLATEGYRGCVFALAQSVKRQLAP